MLAREIMTREPVCVKPNDTAQTVAHLMRQNHCGAAPVVESEENRSLLGIVTDRDLVVRVLALGKPLGTPVKEVMSVDASCCSPDTPLEEIAEIMEKRRVRRVPVIDAAGNCVGLVSLSDLARAAAERAALHDREIGRIVELVSEPLAGGRQEVEVGVHAAQRP